MDKQVNTIRAIRGSLLNDDFLALATLLIKAGYTVRMVTRPAPGKKTKEKVLEYWEDANNG